MSGILAADRNNARNLIATTNDNGQVVLRRFEVQKSCFQSVTTYNQFLVAHIPF